MTWRDQLLAGKYKGVPFFIDSHEFQGGRRIVDHLFPYRDDRWTEDLGMNPRIFNLDIYVVGVNYISARDALTKAFESEGAGILEHPYLGIKTVESVNFTLRESRSEGGICYFSVVFHETSREAVAPIINDIPRQLDQVTEDLDANYLEDFLNFDTKGLNSIDIQALTDYVDTGLAVINKAAKFIPDGDLGLADLSYTVQELQKNTKSLILKPLKLATNILDGLTKIKNLSLSDFKITGAEVNRTTRRWPPKRQIVSESKARRAGLETIVRTFPDADVQQEDYPSGRILTRNKQTFRRLVVGSALSRLTSVAAQTDFATYDEAIEYREFLLTNIDSIMSDDQTTDLLYESMQDLLGLVVSGVPGSYADSSMISKINNLSTTPSVVIAYDLYEDNALEDDLIMRNNVKNPSFVPEGEIEVVAGG